VHQCDAGRMTALGLSAEQVLRVLRTSSDPLTTREVARLAHLSTTTASRVLNNLKDLGAVEMKISGRSYLWTSTAHAGQFLAGASDGERAQRVAVILTAVPLEFSAVRQCLLNGSMQRAGLGVRFLRGTVSGEAIDWTVYVAQAGMGNVATASVVAHAVSELGADLVAFVGIAAGLKPDDQAVGDVLFASRVYNGHSGKEGVIDGEPEFLGRPASFNTPMSLQQLAQAHIAESDWARPVVRRGAGRSSRAPSAHVAPIVSVESVQANPFAEQRKRIATRFNDAGALDMESFGLYSGAHLHNVSAVAVRGISDFIGDKTPAQDQKTQPVGARNAARFLIQLLEKAHPDDFPRTAPEAPRPTPSDPTGSSALPPNGRLWETRLRARSSQRANHAVLDLTRQGEDKSPVATFVNRALHRPPLWLREDDTGDGWAMAAAVASVVGSSAASRAYEKAADVALAAGDSWTAALHRLSAAVERGTGAPEEGQQNRLVDALVNLDLTVQTVLGPVLNFFVAAAKSDIATMEYYAPQALHALAVDPALVGLAPPDDNVTPVELDPPVRQMLASAVLVSLATAWMAPGTADERARGVGAVQHLAVSTRNRVTRDLSLQAIAAASFAVDLMPTSTGARLLAAQARLAAFMAESTAPPRYSDSTQVLKNIEREALKVRDERAAFGGKTADAIAVAAQAHALAGDPEGALRMVLPPPDGVAAPAEATAPEARRVAAYLATLAGRRELAFKLAGQVEEEAEAALLRAGALAREKTMSGEADEAYRSAIQLSEGRNHILTSALFGLARRGIPMAPQRKEEIRSHLERLRPQDPTSADLIEAAIALAESRPEDALVLARKHPDSETAIALRVDALIECGRTPEAVLLLDQQGVLRGDQSMRMDAAITAGRYGLDEEADRIATDVLAAVEGRLATTARQVKMYAARRRSDWAEIATQAQALVAGNAEVIDETQHEEWHWMLAEALYFLDKPESAGRALVDFSHLTWENRDRVRLLFSIVRKLGNRSRVQRVPSSDDRDGLSVQLFELAMAAAAFWADDEELAAFALTTFMTTSIPGLHEGQVARIREFSEDYFKRHADSGSLTAVNVGDDLQGLIDYLREAHTGQDQALKDLAAMVWAGRLPACIIPAAQHRSYAEFLIKGALGCFIAVEHDDEPAGQRAAAAAVATGSTVIDTSAIIVGPKIGTQLTALTAEFDQVILPELLRRDIENAQLSLSLRSQANLGWDAQLQRPILVEFDTGTVEAWAEAADELLGNLRHFVVIPDTESPDYELEHHLWDAAVSVARNRGVAVWADDQALRNYARASNVAAFSTLDLLTVSRGTHITTSDAIATLRSHRVVDLPIDENWANTARREDWSLDGYVPLIIARPGTWENVELGFWKYRHLIRALPDRDNPTLLARWAATAATGLAHRTHPTTRAQAVGALLAWTAFNTDAAFSGITHTESLVDVSDAKQSPIPGQHVQALLQVGEDLNRSLFPDGRFLHAFVSSMTQSLRGGLSAGEVSGLMATVISGLDEEHRRRVLEVFLLLADNG
jgi:nucleoside phosphorylase